MTRAFWHGKKQYYHLLLYAIDVIAFAAATHIAARVTGIPWSEPFYLRLYLFAFVMLVILYTNYQLYSNRRNLFDEADFMHLLYANSLTAILICAFIFLFNPRDGILYTTTLLVMALNTITTTSGRALLDRLIYHARRKGYDVKRTIFFGDEDDELVEKLKEKRLGYKLIKVTKDRDTLKKHLPRAEVVFLKMTAIDDEMLDIITSNSKVSWKIVSSLLNLVIDPVSFDEFKDYPLITISDDDATKTYLAVKRAMDVILSGAALIILSPLLLLIGLLVKATSPGPVFYAQERLGKDLKPFTLYKFRTMRKDADQEKDRLRNEVSGLFKMKDDPRTTKAGKFLRRSCLDELPQLINILLGDMSIVGPRPHLQQELPHFKGWRRARFKVKPGLTGLWQVNGRHQLNFDKAVLYDVYYVKHLSFLMDASIILKTIPAIIMAKGRF